MENAFKRFVHLIDKKHRSYFSRGGIAFALRLAGGPSHILGRGHPEFTVVVKDKEGMSALSTLDATAIFEAYMSDALDIQGDMLKFFALRGITSDRHFLRYLWCFVRPWLFGQISTDKKGIARHYDYDNDFYLQFLDTRHRCYSQGIFTHDGETLEEAMTRKLDFVAEATGLRPGQEALDIGGGWGAFTEYAGGKGVRVTSITISKESEKFLSALIREKNLPCQVVRQHLFEFNSGKRFDAIVNLGVTEHLPDYKASLARYRLLLKPGGRVYLDASACRRKYNFHSFIYRHIYPGNCSPMCLHDYLAEVAKTPFRLKGVYDDRHSYYLTALHWARNLDKNRFEVAGRWGEQLYRKFQLYLWGTVDVFRRDAMQAYRLVLELP